MSKINQIQKAILEKSGAEFHKLADAYLHKKGYKQINSIGAFIGANKDRKGTPDSLIALPNGRYIFTEYTAQQTKIFEKFIDDLEKCFDTGKTGILLEKIEKIILCHASTLNSQEEEKLREKCQSLDVNLEIYGISSISYDLLQKYPGITRDFLGISVDTGQILLPEEFVEQYNKSALSASLDTKFCFREEEVKQIFEQLQNNDLLIVIGKAGVGKTRISLEACSSFIANHSEYRAYCILQRGSDIFEDLQVYFSEPGSYLILVDDANRINNFDYFVQLINFAKEGQRFKIIATVRDYAANSISQIATACSKVSNIFIEPMKDEQVVGILKDAFGIKNQHYLNRIQDIAQGNPRLAAMAAKVAIETNQIESLNDISSLYDQYYSSIKTDLASIGEDLPLKVCGIVSFLRNIDSSDKELMDVILSILEIDKITFWATVRSLHDLEIFDLHENEIVRVSDQVLSTYLFYLSVFKKEALDFSLLLEHFFPQFKRRFIDSLNPVIDAFDSELLMKKVEPHINRIWNIFIQSQGRNTIIDLINLFWFIKPVDSLQYIHEEINKIQPVCQSIDKTDNKTESDNETESLLHALAPFSHLEENNCVIAIELAVNYLLKRPKDLLKVVKLLTDDFGFEADSYLRGYKIQILVIDHLMSRIGLNGDEPLLKELYLAVASSYLGITFSKTQARKINTISWSNFNLTSTEELYKLRKNIWRNLFAVLQEQQSKIRVLEFIHKYSSNLYGSQQEIEYAALIVECDYHEVFAWINANLTPDEYLHCLVVQNYINNVRKYSFSFDQDIADKFTNNIYETSKVVLVSNEERRYLDLGFDEYEKFRRQKIEGHFANFDLDDYKEFFCQCELIYDLIDWHPQSHQFTRKFEDVLNELSDRDVGLYLEVISYYLRSGDKHSINLIVPLKRLFRLHEPDEVLKFIDSIDFAGKERWKFGFYQLLPSDCISRERVDELYSLYEVAEVRSLPHDLDYLLKYLFVDNEVFPRVIQCLTEKIDESKLSSNVRIVLSRLFNQYTEAGKQINALFSNHVSLLEKAYLEAEKFDANFDHNGIAFEEILSMDSDFLVNYVENFLSGDNGYKRLERNFPFIWRSEKYLRVLKITLEYLFEVVKERPHRYSIFHVSERLFILNSSDSDNEALWQRQDQFMSNIIKEKNGDSEFMIFIFRIVSGFSYDRRKALIRALLNLNQDFNLFQDLPLEPSHRTWSGSAVPMLNQRLQYYQSLLELFDSVRLLKHKLFVQKVIETVRNEIEQEKRRDFLGFW